MTEPILPRSTPPGTTPTAPIPVAPTADTVPTTATAGPVTAGSVNRAAAGWRGWPRAARVTVVASCLVAVAAVAFGITMATARPWSTAAGTSVPTAASPGGSGAGAGGSTGSGAGKPKHPRLRGTLTAVSGDTWTMRSAKSGVITVTITPATRFGSPKVPAKRSDFAVGDPVVVVSTSTGLSVTAVRVAAPQPHGASSPEAAG